MASIEINFNIMSHHGKTDRDVEASPHEREDEGKREEDLSFEPRNLFPIHHSIRSEISTSRDPQTGGFDVSGFAMFGGNDSATGNVDDLSSAVPGSELGFVNRRFSSRESRPSPRPPPPPPSLFNEGGSFDIDNLVLNPLIDVNEPASDFPAAQSLEGNNDASEGTVSASVLNRYEKQYIDSMYAQSSFTRLENDEHLDRKPAAIDPTLLHNQQQRYINPNQDYLYPTQASNQGIAFNRNINPSVRDDTEEEKEHGERKPPPEASLPRGSDRSPQETRKARRNLKPTPKASLPAIGVRRSTRRANRTTRTDAIPKKGHPRATKFTRPKTRARPKIKKGVKRKLSSEISCEPTKKQLREARTQRKMKALRTWYKRAQELLEFIDENDHANVPQQYPKNHSLGIWVNKQRMEKKAKEDGKPSSLTDEKIELLEKVGFLWAKRKGQAAWEEKYRELQKFKEENKHCNVPTKNKVNRALGRWVSTQRSNYKRWKKGDPPKQRHQDWEEAERRIERLNSIGFQWSLLPGGTEAEVEEEEEDDDEKISNDMETTTTSKNSTATSSSTADSSPSPEKNKKAKEDRHD